MSTTKETSLGDGLYASFDGWQVVLRAPRTDGDHWVGIEPDVMESLVQFIADLQRQFPDQKVPVWESLRAGVTRAGEP